MANYLYFCNAKTERIMERYYTVIENAVEILRQGGTLLYPTDTIWGLGCDASRADAVERLYAIKHRDHSKSMLILCADLAMVERYVGPVPPAAAALLVATGRPTTVILPAGLPDRGGNATLLADNLAAADGSIGVRIPQHALCQRLLALLGRPIVSTSANRSGEPSPSCYEEIGWGVVNAVDFCLPKGCEGSHSSQASRIVKLLPDGCIRVIRD